MRRRGFTLLEVLAAVAIVGLVFTALAGAAMQSIRSQGIGERRLRASLVADRRITEIETEVHLGTAPAIGELEEEEEEFLVQVVVEPFQPPVELQPEFAGSDDRPSLFQEAAPGVAGTPSTGPPMRVVRVSVSWLEGIHEYQVSRTTYALDGEAASGLLESVAEQLEGEGGADGDAEGDGSQPLDDARDLEDR